MQAGGRRITVATYNIHRCIGTDRRRAPERVLRVIRSMAADIVGLQEISTRGDSLDALELLETPHHTTDGADSDQLAFLADMLRYHVVAGPNLIDHDGRFGNALLTRFPVLAARRHDLAVPEREARGAIDAYLDVDGRTVRVLVTHFGLSSAERRHQVRQLADIIADPVHLDDHEPVMTVLMGDMNEWNPLTRGLRPFDAILGRARGRRSFPAAVPLLALDRIWTDPDQAVESVRAFRQAGARVASDHLPVVATLQLPE